jgi:hypothetical protein
MNNEETKEQSSGLELPCWEVARAPDADGVFSQEALT